jgi:hypothetical protein
MYRKLWFAVLWLSIAAASLGGCSSMPSINVLGGCEIPQAYDVHKPDPADVPTGTTIKSFVEAATADHAQHKQDVNDFNGLHDYVATNCK